MRVINVNIITHVKGDIIPIYRRFVWGWCSCNLLCILNRQSKGVQLYVERKRALDIIAFVETLVSSIANRPKFFGKEFIEISVNRKK